MIMYHHIRQLVVQEFLPKRSDFPGKRQRLDFFCFRRVTNTHQDKSHISNVSQCVAKASGLCSAVTS